MAAALALGLSACGPASSPSGHSSLPSPPSPPSSSAPSATAPAATPAGGSGTAATRVITYTPWTAGGSLASGITVSSTLTGSCFTASDATTRTDAFRCMVGNTLYDPCFAASASASECAAPDAQDPESVTVIKLTAPLPAPNTPPTAVVPWLLVLSNGQRCVTNTGTVPILGGKYGYYVCGDGIAYGTPDESTAAWTITYAPSGATASVMIQVGITTAYE